MVTYYRDNVQLGYGSQNRILEHNSEFSVSYTRDSGVSLHFINLSLFLVYICILAYLYISNFFPLHAGCT